MTLVFAARCGDGVVVAGDISVMKDRDLRTNDVQHKVEAIDKHTIVGFAGNRYLGQYFIRNMGKAAQDEPRPMSEWVTEAEKILNQLWEDYSRPTEDKELDEARKEDNGNNGNLETLVVGLDELDNGKARIYRIETKLVPDMSDDIEFLGEGISTGQGALAILWNEDVATKTPIGEAWPLAVAAMKMVSTKQYAVGGIPDVYLVRDNSGQSRVEPSEVKKVYNSAEEVLKEIPEYVIQKLQSTKD